MKRRIYLSLLILTILSSCKLKKEVDGIFITGDHTSIMRNWQGEKYGLMHIANFSDSSKITYPAYLLQINSRYGIFHVQNSENEPTIRYYTLKPDLKTNDKQTIELASLKLIFGKGVINGEEIIDPDDTKNVILDGAILKK